MTQTQENIDDDEESMNGALVFDGNYMFFVSRMDLS